MWTIRNGDGIAIVGALMDHGPRPVKASVFTRWWERLIIICPPDAPLEKETCEAAWKALEITGQEAGAIPRGPGALDTDPTFDWQNETIDFAIQPMYSAFPRYNPETMIQTIVDLTGIPE